MTPNRFFWLVVLASLSSGAFQAAQAQDAHDLTNARKALENQAPVFIENKGQYVTDVKFLYCTKGLDMWILGNAVVFDVHCDQVVDTNGDQIQSGNLNYDMRGARTNKEVIHRTGSSVRMEFENASSSLTVLGEAQQQGINNYFIGNDSTKWATNVHRFRGARVQTLYEGIDASYYLDNGLPRYDLIIQPGADPSKICMTFKGQDSLFSDETGNLIIRTSIGDLTQQGLYAYQIHSGKKEPIACHYLLNEGGKVTFQVGNYDRSLPLIIDPLIYSTYLGGAFADYTSVGSCVAADRKGNAYISGTSLSNGTIAYPSAYPSTPGAYQTQSSATTFGFVTKLNSTGTALVYSTYVCGQNGNFIDAMALDSSGDVFIAGSGEIPTTPGAYNTSGGSCFVTKLNPSGNKLVYSTLFEANAIRCMAIDPQGCAYIAGDAAINSTPITPGAYKTQYPPSQEFLFVTKLNASGSGLIYSTSFGSTAHNSAWSIALDSSENAYITGQTSIQPSDGPYPTTPGAFQSMTLSKYGDYVFVTKLNTKGTDLVYSALIGGNLDQYGKGIAVDGFGNAYVMGWTTSTDGGVGNFPTTPNAFQHQKATPYIDSQAVFVTKLNSTGTELIYSTLLGGEDVDIGIGFTIDTSGNAYIAGRTKSHLYPTSADAFQLVNSASGYEATFTELNATGSGLIYSTYLGGEADNMAMGIALDDSCDIYVAGHTSSAGTFPIGFPVTSGVVQPQNNGGYDAFVMKFGPMKGARTDILSYRLDTLSLSICDSLDDSVRISNLGTGAITIDSATLNHPFYLLDNHLPYSLSARTPLVLHMRIIPETSGPISAQLTLYYHSSDGNMHDSVIILNSNVRGAVNIGVRVDPKTLSASAGDTVQLELSMVGNLDSATSATLKTLSISLDLHTDLLTPVSIIPDVPGVLISELVINNSSVTFTITFPAGFEFTTIAHLVTVYCIPYLTDLTQTGIRLSVTQFGMSNTSCVTLEVLDDSSTFTLIPRCGDSTILRFMNSGVLAFSIIPNPAVSEVQIGFINPTLFAISYQIVDVLGTIRAEGEAFGNVLRLDVHSLSSGLYYLRLRIPAIAASTTGRFMIQR